MRHVRTFTTLLILLGGCGSEPEPSVPTSVTVDPPFLSLTALGQSQQLSATVTDQDGDPVSGVSVIWNSSNPGVASVSSTGVVSAHANGSAQVIAIVGSATATVEVSVAQAADQIVKVSGDQQTGAAGEPLPAPLVVQVNDALGNPVSGAAVIFTVSQGGGSVTPTTGATAPDGRASTSFTLGTAADLPQQVLAGISATTVTVSFSAIATAPVSSFNITLRYLSTPTARQLEAFEAARARWETLITGDLEGGLLQVDAATCGDDSPSVNEQVDDLLIFVTVEPIDGPNATLGQAGPCLRRRSDGLPVLGVMRFDNADLDELEAEGLLKDVVLHEMGHVLGFGTLWFGGLLADPTVATPPGTDPHFTGAAGRAAFDAVGGSAYTGSKVPVDNSIDTDGNPIIGRADYHWRESVFGNELMTAFIDPQNPLSIVTVASLGDLGYVVNFSSADSFTLMPSLVASMRGPRRTLQNDVLRLPIRTVDMKGRVTGELRR